MVNVQKRLDYIKNKFGGKITFLAPLTQKVDGVMMYLIKIRIKKSNGKVYEHEPLNCNRPHSEMKNADFEHIEYLLKKYIEDDYK